MHQHGLAVLLNEHFDSIEIAQLDRIDETTASGKTDHPDIIIIGIGDTDPLVPTLDTITRTRKFYPKVPVILYDGEMRAHWIQEYFRKGINGYVRKNEPLEELLTCIRKVFHGNRFISVPTLILLLRSKTMTF